MVFVLAWTIGDASSLSSQSLYQFHFVCSMSCGIMKLPKSNTVLKCSTIEKVAMKPCGHFDYLPQPFMPLRSGVSFLLCTERMWKLGGI
jgi:hypothetical protein